MCAISMPVGGHNLQEDQIQQWHPTLASEASLIPEVLTVKMYSQMHDIQTCINSGIWSRLEAVLQRPLLLPLLSLTSSNIQLL